MNNVLKRILSIVLSVTLLISSVTVLNTVSVTAADNTYIMEASGWYESAYVTWTTVPNATGFAAYVKGANESDSAYVQLDNELIRKYPTYFRADAVGLKAGQYVLKIVPYINGSLDESKAFVTDTLNVQAYDRSGFAFSSNSPFKTASGAYNDDGTLKSNAKVFYVTKDTAKTITADVITSSKGTTETFTGLQAIITAKQKGYDTTPFDFRIIGTIEAEDMDGFDSSAEGLQIKGRNSYSELNITIEGIGEDAGIRNFGILMRNAGNVELRNFAIMLCMEDCVSLDTDNTNIWIHNLDLFYGQKGSAADQIKGDGTIDIKGDSQYVTVSYNHLYDCGKASLCGMTSESGPNYITYHHNWFDHSDSRHPRIRTMSVHVYNNYYDGNSKYGIGASAKSSAFVENNYFVDCKYPTLQGGMGHDNDGKGGSNMFTDSSPTGVIKFYNNKLTGTYQFTPDNKNTISNPAGDAYVVETRNEVIPSTYKTTLGATYSNFDTNSSIDLGVNLADITPVDDVPAVVMAGAGRMNGGDFFETTGTSRSDYIGLTSATYDSSDHVIDDVLKAAITNYKPTLVSVGGLTTGGNVDTTVSTSTTTTTEATTETITEAPTETTTASTPVEIGEAQTGFTSDSDTDTGSGVSVTYNAANNSWVLTDTSDTAAAEVTIPFAEQTSGKVIISGTAEPSTTASKWAFVQIRGTKADGTPSEIIGFGGGTNKADLSVRVNGAATYTKLGTLAAKNYEYTIVMDLDNKTAEVTVDGITQRFNVDVASINALYSTTSKTQLRNVTISVPYVGILGDEPDSTTEATTEITTAVTTETTTAATTETTETTTKEVTTEATSETTTEIVPPTPGIVYGDVDGNGKREISDVVLLIDQIRKGSVEPISGINDVTMDGRVDTADVATILQKILNDSYKMPCEPDEEETTENTTEITTDKTTVVTTEITTETTTEIATETTTVDNISADRMEGDIVSDGVNLAAGAYFDGQLIIADNNDAAWTSKAQIPVMTIGNRTYSTFVQGAGNPKSADGKQSYNAQGKLVIPEQGAYIKVVPTSDATLMIDYKVAAGKQFAIMSVDAAGNKTEIVYKSPSDDEYYSEQYALTAGNTYYVTSAGTKTCFYGIALINSLAPVITTEATTEITTVVTTEGTTEDTSSEPIDKISTGVPMAKDKITLYGDESFKAEILKGSSDEIVANALYVSPTGSDSNTGTASAPFKTVQKALDTVKAGQTIYLREGTYTALNTFKSSGTEGNYITLRNYPGEKPYLTMTAGSSGAILRLDGNDYIKIEGLEIGGLSSAIAQGILLDGNENHVIIRNNDIHNFVTTKPGENENGEANAILCYGEGKTEEDSINNICIENNLVHNNTTGWCESVSVTGNTKYVNIINNTVYDNTNIGIDFYGNAGYCSIPALDQPRYCVAAGNVIYGSICDYAECAGLYVDGARDIVLENNISHDNMYGIEIGSEELQADYPVKNIIARNNLVYNNSAGGIRVGGYDRNKTGYVTDTKIYNNTVVNNGEGEGGWNGELCFVKCDGVDVRNNIVYKDNKNYPMIGGDLAKEYVKNVTFSNNVFYNPLGAEEIYFEFAKGSAEGIAAFNEQTGGNDTFGKPDFNADYSLKAGSYGIDAGADVSNDMGTLTDLANNGRIINTIDLGAFEYQG